MLLLLLSRFFFFPAASTQFWMVAKGTKTRWSRHKSQLAER